MDLESVLQEELSRLAPILLAASANTMQMMNVGLNEARSRTIRILAKSAYGKPSYEPVNYTKYTKDVCSRKIDLVGMHFTSVTKQPSVNPRIGLTSAVTSKKCSASGETQYLHNPDHLQRQGSEHIKRQGMSIGPDTSWSVRCTQTVSD